MNSHFLTMPPVEFVKFLKSNGINKFYFVYNEKEQKVVSSHDLLKPIADFLNTEQRDFKKHEGLFFQISSKYDTLFGAFVHRTNRGQGAGGLRYWTYNSYEEFLRDGLRLSMGMTHKNALAGLWWGGGKGIMAYNPSLPKNDPDIRRFIYSEYGAFVSSLNGCYITAEDVGTTVADMETIHSQTRFATCIPPKIGGSGNPSVPTARGVVAGMEAAMDFLGASLAGKTIAIQGLGNVGNPLVGFLFEKGVTKIIGFDIFEDCINQIKCDYPEKNIETYLVSRDDLSIFQTECDIFSANATGGIFNPNTIPILNTKVLCGAANNQLEDPIRDDHAIHNRGILYIPDFLTNRMGIVNCADEHAGYVFPDPFIERHLSKDWEHSIHKLTIEMLAESKKTGKTTGIMTVEMAEKFSVENNPIYGHRGKMIIDSLVRSNWQNH